MMGFWVFMLLADIMIPLVMIIFGRIFIKSPPKNINDMYGYRTTMSMKNTDTWNFAHKYCGRLWFKTGMIILPISVFALGFFFGRETDTVGLIGGIICCLQMIPLILSVILTEVALKKTFDNVGNRKRT